MLSKKIYLSENEVMNIPFKKLCGKTVRITATNGKKFEGEVADYIYPEDNAPEKVEGFVIDDMISGQPIAFTENDIKTIKEIPMKPYVALLRGINVGGKNKIFMPALKAVFEEAGFWDVQTYINSGNILFSADEDSAAALAQTCKTAIARAFSLDIPVAVLSAYKLIAAVKNAPPWWGQSKTSRHDAIFLLPPLTAEEVLAMVGPIKPEYEQLGSYAQVVFWSAPLATFSKTRFSKIVATSAYRSMTIRNANTTKKLAELLQPKGDDLP